MLSTPFSANFQGIRAIFIVACTLALIGCRREEVTSYSVPKETNAPVAVAADARIHWKVPAGWQEVPGNSLRVGNFAIAGASGKKAEVSVIPFPGSAGGELENVNRWRGQIGLGPVTAAEVVSENVTVGGVAGKLFDLGAEAPSGQRTVAASVNRDGTSWFFKLTGDATVVVASKPAFLEFLQSVSFAGTDGGITENKPASTNTRKVDTGADKPPLEAAAGDAAAGQPKWEVPPGWNKVMPTAMILAKFVADGAEVTVSMFPGDAGGLAANVNRWRGQMSLPPLGAAEAEKSASSFDVLGGKAMLVEMNGTGRTGQPARLIAAIVSRDGQSWFYKLMGDPAATAAQKDSFMKFVQSARY